MIIGTWYIFLEVDSKGKKKHIGPPSCLDWENTRIFIKFLKLFYGVTLKFLGSLHVTCYFFFHELVSMQTHISKLSKNGYLLTGGMTTNIICKFDKY
jgi:hypothetical protein